MRRAITILLILSQIVLASTSCSSRRIESVPMVAPSIVLKPGDIGSRIKIETTDGSSVSGFLRAYTDSTIVYGRGNWPDRTIAVAQIERIQLVKVHTIGVIGATVLSGVLILLGILIYDMRGGFGAS